MLQKFIGKKDKIEESETDEDSEEEEVPLFIKSKTFA